VGDMVGRFTKILQAAYTTRIKFGYNNYKF